MLLQAACKLLSGFTGRLFEHNASEVYVLLVRIDDVYPSLRGRAQGHGGVPRHAQMPIDLRLNQLGLVDVQMPHLLGKHLRQQGNAHIGFHQFHHKFPLTGFTHHFGLKARMVSGLYYQVI